MSFSHIASKEWPDVQWHGESNIHVSVCWGGAMGVGKKDWKTAMAILHQKQVGQHIWRYLQKTFHGMVWIISMEEFTHLFLVDCYRHIHEMGDSESHKKIKNPHTGNVFHRIALKDDFIGAIRFWCDPYGDDELALGFRFRIVKQDEEEESTRERTRETVTEAEEMVEEVLDSFMEIKEPPKSSEVEQLLIKLEED